MSREPGQSSAADADLRFLQTDSGSDTAHRPEPITAADHHLGGLGAPLELIEYGDYECPYCAMAQPGVRDLVAKYQDDLVFAFRHLPLVSQHPHAWGAALAAEAAGRQGKFWAMHDLLLSHKRGLTHDDLVAYARGLGLDLVRFELDLTKDELAEHVRHDALGATQSRVRGTPTFFVNGSRLEGGYRETEIEDALQAAQRPR